MIGKKRVFVAALIALSLGALLPALATDITVLIIARAIQGIGGCRERHERQHPHGRRIDRDGADGR
ncbi:hypothetical protein AB0M44_35025 [Streptosporangium subroseum]|uniref:hypothetical protein n=1 Tax=Streptosporangium subroseum TaxID=106412 RepID=UPI003445A3B4